jgi:hypothetical protein
MSHLSAKQIDAVKAAVGQLDQASQHAQNFYVRLTAQFGYRHVLPYWGVSCVLQADASAALISTPYGNVIAVTTKVIEDERPQIRLIFKMQQDAELEHLEIHPFVWMVHVDSFGIVSSKDGSVVNLADVNKQTVENALQELAMSLIYAIGTRPRKAI